jgi:cardiolipin synthase A/B
VLYDRLLAGGIEVGVVRAAQVRAPSDLLGGASARRWNLRQLGHIDHRKLLVIDGRTGWVGGAGIEDHFQDGRFHDVLLRVTGPVAAQLQLVFVATFRWLGGEIGAVELDGLFPLHPEVSGSSPAIVLHNAPGRCRPITDAIGDLMSARRGRSMSSTRTSQTVR